MRVFRYAPASPFHLTRYETKQIKPAPKDPQKGSTNLTKYWQRKGDHFSLRRFPVAKIHEPLRSTLAEKTQETADQPEGPIHPVLIGGDNRFILDRK